MAAACSDSPVSIIEPEIEYVDRATESIRYLEHGWPTKLSRWHAHEEYELHLIVRTRGKTFVGDYIGEFGPGSLFLTGPNLPHNWVTQESSKAVKIRDMLVQFNDRSIRSLCDAFAEFRDLAPLFEQSRSGIEFVEFDPAVARARLERVRDSRGPERILALLRMLMELNAHKNRKALSVVSLTYAGTNDKQARIGTVVDHLVENYAGRHSVASVASLAGMSPSAFSRNFRSRTGNNFVEFLNRVRIGQACNLLYSTEEQVSEICYEVGFQNLANFNRRFLRMKGMTPSEYRSTARRELAPETRSGADA